MHLDRFTKMHDSGEMIGAFVSGTASVVGKVYSIMISEKLYEFNDDDLTHVSKIKKMLTDIQHGHIDHPFTTVLK